MTEFVGVSYITIKQLKYVKELKDALNEIIFDNYKNTFFNCQPLEVCQNV